MAQTKVKLISDGVIVQGNLHSSHGITTAHIGEGSNLYYTDARVGSYLSTNSFATESYVGTQITNLVDSSPATLNTLNELAAALGDDPNFATTTATSIGLKAPLASPSFTGNANFAGSVTSTGLNVNAGTYHKVIATFPATYTTNLQIGQQFNVNNDALTDTVTFAHTGTEAASDFIFTVAGNEKLKIQGNGNATFAGEISSSDDINVNNGKLVVNHASAEVRIKSTSDTGESYINFSDPSDINPGQIYYGHSNNTMSFRTNDISQMSISNNLIVFPSTGVHEIRGDRGSGAFAIGNMGDASSQMMVSSRGFLTFNVSNTGSALNATERMSINSDGLVTLASMSSNDTRQLTFMGDSNSTSGNGGAIGMFANETRLTSNWYYNSGQQKYVAGNGQAVIGLSTGTTDATSFIGFGVNGPADSAGPTLRMKITSAGVVKVENTAAAHLILNGDTNNSGDTGQVDSVIDLLGDGNPGIYGYRINTENWSGQTALNFQEYLNGSYTSRLFISKDGDVGIGTTNPNDHLEVYGAGEQWIRVTSSDGGVNGFRTQTSTGSRQNTLYRDSTSNLLTLRAGTDDGELAFIVGGSTAERMRIKSGGNVGIGTTSPSSKLQIQANQHATNPGGKNYTGSAINADGGDIATGKLFLQGYQNTANDLCGFNNEANRVVLYNYTDGRHLQLWNHTGDTSIPNGSVGIGTTSPSAKLVVAQSNVTEPSGVDANTSILIKNNTWSGMTLLATSSTGSFLTFGDENAGFAGRIQYIHSNDNMIFETAATERMRILGDGSQTQIKGKHGGGADLLLYNTDVTLATDQ